MNTLGTLAKIKRAKLQKHCSGWDGKDKNFLFDIEGWSDSDFAKDPETRRSVGG